MLSIFRHLIKNNSGALTPKYTVISGMLASLIALSSIAIKLAVLPAHATGM